MTYPHLCLPLPPQPAPTHTLDHSIQAHVSQKSSHQMNLRLRGPSQHTTIHHPLSRVPPHSIQTLAHTHTHTHNCFNMRPFPLSFLYSRLNMADYLLDAGAARAYPYMLVQGDNCSQPNVPVWANLENVIDFWIFELLGVKQLCCESTYCCCMNSYYYAAMGVYGSP